MIQSKLVSIMLILMTVSNQQLVIGLPFMSLDYNSEMSLAQVTGSLHDSTNLMFNLEEVLNKTLELKKTNEALFNQAINACKYAPLFMTSHSNEMNEDIEANCYGSTIELDLGMYYANRIFLVDDLTLGVISSSGLTISIYRIATPELSLELLSTKYFNRYHVPYDACADLSKNIFVLSQEKLTKYKLNENSALVKAKTIFIQSSSIACHANQVYVNDRLNNRIRVYSGDDLEQVETLDAKGVIFSMNHALGVDSNVKAFVDGLDSVAVLDEHSQACHFYKSLMCIEDLRVMSESSNVSSIFVVDSCERDIKQFIYTPNKRLYLENKFTIGQNFSLVSMVKNGFNYLIVLANYPSKINILDLNRCLNK